MKCPFRKLISTTKEVKEDGLINEATTEVFAECLEDDCMAYKCFNCGLIGRIIKNT